MNTPLVAGTDLNCMYHRMVCNRSGWKSRWIQRNHLVRCMLLRSRKRTPMARVAASPWAWLFFRNVYVRCFALTPLAAEHSCAARSLKEADTYDASASFSYFVQHPHLSRRRRPAASPPISIPIPLPNTSTCCCFCLDATLLTDMLYNPLAR